MAFPKPSQELTDFVAPRAIAAGCEQRKMFGCAAFFANDNMVSGIFGDGTFLRFSDTDRADFFAQYDDSGLFDPMGGRPMREYATVPPAVLEDPPTFEAWLAKSVAYAKSIPPKARKKSKSSRKKKD
jgi:hypothetical protein